MKKLLACIAVLIFCPAAFAATGQTASSYPEGFTSTSGIISGQSLSSVSSAGDLAIGTSSSERYSSGAGAASISSIRQTNADTTPPSIRSIKFGGFTIKNNDYVMPSVEVTAFITDESGVDPNTSSVEVIAGPINTTTSFSALTSPSTYEISSGALVYKPGFSEGTYTFKIYARDIFGNQSSSETITFIVGSGDLEILGPVLNYPNPFAPPAQSTKICYMLNKDADVKIYFYNLVGQIIKKVNASKGSQGGHAGYNEVSWDGISDFGDVVSNGVYFIKIVSDNKIIGKVKIAVIK